VQQVRLTRFAPPHGSQRKQASSKERTFPLLDRGLFSQDGNSYAFAISHAEGDGSLLDFMVFAAPDQSFDFRLTFTDRIEMVDTGDPGDLSDPRKRMLRKATWCLVSSNRRRPCGEWQAADCGGKQLGRSMQRVPLEGPCLSGGQKQNQQGTG
jgi:hypothetical protein